MNTRIRAGMALGAAAVAAFLVAGSTPATAAPVTKAAPAAEGVSASSDLVKTALARLEFRKNLAKRAAGAKGAASPTAAAPLPADGAFVRDPQTGTVYRVVGRSLIYVSTWAPFGGVKPTVALTAAMYEQARQYPLDGTFVTSIQERRVYRFVGGAPIVVTTWAAFGGKAQKTIPIDSNAILQAGRCGESEAAEKYCHVAERPDELDISFDATGVVVKSAPRVFIRGGQDGRIYRLAGGAPIYVSSWTPYGGPKPTITVDAVAIDRAGQSGPLSHLAAKPDDNIVLRDPATGQVFTVIGGAPVYVSHPAALTVTEEESDFTVKFVPGNVDRAAIDRAGQAGPWKFLSYYPANGVKLYAADTGNSYVVVDGRAESTSDGNAVVAQWWDDEARVGFVGQATIDRAGPTGQWSHLKAPLG